MKRFLLAALFMALLCRASAQDSLAVSRSNLYDQIVSRTSVPTLVAKGREMLLEKLLDNDLGTASEIISLLQSQTETTRYVAFSYWEQQMLLYWTGHFNEICLNAAAMANESAPTTETYVYPPYDELRRTLYTQSRQRAPQIEAQVDLSACAAEEKEFLKIFLDWLIVPGNDYDALREINRQVDAFAARYPSSAYNPVMQKEMTTRESDWAWGLGLGMGVAMLPDDMAQLCGNAGFDFDMRIAAAYKKTLMEFSFGFKLSTIDEPVLYGGREFIPGDPWMIIGVDLLLGRTVWEQGRVSLTPFISGGYSGFDLTFKDEQNVSESKSSFRYGAGAYLDVRVGKNSTGLSPWGYPTNTHYGYVNLRLRYDAQVADYKIPSVRRGIVQSITFEYMLFARKINR